MLAQYPICISSPFHIQQRAPISQRVDVVQPTHSISIATKINWGPIPLTTPLFKFHFRPVIQYYQKQKCESGEVRTPVSSVHIIRGSRVVIFFFHSISHDDQSRSKSNYLQSVMTWLNVCSTKNYVVMILLMKIANDWNLVAVPVVMMEFDDHLPFCRRFSPRHGSDAFKLSALRMEIKLCKQCVL